jgi:acyl-CoA synthetase
VQTARVADDVVARYVAAGWWDGRIAGDLVRRYAAERPTDAALITPERTFNWTDYERLAQRLAAALAGPAAAAVGDRVAVLLPDGLAVHAALVATQRAGLVAVGIGVRAGVAEIGHLITRTGADALVTSAVHRGRSSEQLLDELAAFGVTPRVVVTVENDENVAVHERGKTVTDLSGADLSGRALGPTELFLLNSTSGTTGLPKCVMQFESRWFHFADLAAEAGPLGADDVFLGAVPAPFGFGLWTSHFAPVSLGVPTVVLPRFTPEEMIRMIERERVTVLCCVSTQFRMLLNSSLAAEHDLSSLRVMFTGGEAIPFEQAREFEQRTGALVLQFFGSNETGAFSYTRHTDPVDVRLRTAGRLIEHMNVRLFDDDGTDITETGGPGQPGGCGPLTCLGYYDDDAANRQLFTADGAMLMGDLVTIEDGVLEVVGRKSDIVIRGGKNISAAQVEAEVGTHPAVDLVVVVPVADPVFGEKVAALVTLRAGASTLTLEDLGRHLDARGTTKELHPEHLVIVDRIPRSSGGKLAKGEARRIVLERLGQPA